MTFKRAVVLTVYDRFNYIEEVLDSWMNVRDLENWDFYISYNRSSSTASLKNLIDSKLQGSHVSYEEIFQPSTLSVLEHHYQVFEQLFSKDYEFVMRVDDDLVVSNDILEYFKHFSNKFYSWPYVVSIHAYADDPTTVHKLEDATMKQEFSPWIYGFWKNKWEVIRDTWDRDYSTYEDTPGNKSGYDWNLNLRVYPKYGYHGIYPEVCRVRNIGAWGTHGTPDLLPPAIGFNLHNEKVFN